MMIMIIIIINNITLLSCYKCYGIEPLRRFTVSLYITLLQVDVLKYFHLSSSSFKIPSTRSFLFFRIRLLV